MSESVKKLLSGKGLLAELEGCRNEEEAIKVLKRENLWGIINYPELEELKESYKNGEIEADGTLSLSQLDRVAGGMKSKQVKTKQNGKRKESRNRKKNASSASSSNDSITGIAIEQVEAEKVSQDHTPTVIVNSQASYLLQSESITPFNSSITAIGKGFGLMPKNIDEGNKQNEHKEPETQIRIDAGVTYTDGRTEFHDEDGKPGHDVMPTEEDLSMGNRENTLNKNKEQDNEEKAEQKQVDELQPLNENDEAVTSEEAKKVEFYEEESQNDSTFETDEKGTVHTPEQGIVKEVQYSVLAGSLYKDTFRVVPSNTEGMSYFLRQSTQKIQTELNEENIMIINVKNMPEGTNIGVPYIVYEEINGKRVYRSYDKNGNRIDKTEDEYFKHNPPVKLISEDGESISDFSYMGSSFEGGQSTAVFVSKGKNPGKASERITQLEKENENLKKKIAQLEEQQKQTKEQHKAEQESASQRRMPTLSIVRKKQTTEATPHIGNISAESSEPAILKEETLSKKDKDDILKGACECLASGNAQSAIDPLQCHEKNLTQKEFISFLLERLHTFGFSAEQLNTVYENLFPLFLKLKWKAIALTPVFMKISELINECEIEEQGRINAQREAEEQRKRAEQERIEKAKREAEQRQAEERARLEEEQRKKAEQERIEKAKQEAEERARRKTEERARLEEEQRKKAEQERIEKAKQEAEEIARRKTEERARLEEEQRKRAEEEKLRREEEARKEEKRKKAERKKKEKEEKEKEKRRKESEERVAKKREAQSKADKEKAKMRKIEEEAKLQEAEASLQKEITALLKEANKLPSLSEEDQAFIEKIKEERKGNIGLERLQEIKKQLETMKEKYKLVQTETTKPADDADKADKTEKKKIRGKISKLNQDFTSKCEKLANEENSLSEEQKKSLEDMIKRMAEIDEERSKAGISVEELITLQAEVDAIMKYIQSLEDTENAKKEKLKNDISKSVKTCGEKIEGEKKRRQELEDKISNLNLKVLYEIDLTSDEENTKKLFELSQHLCSYFSKVSSAEVSADEILNINKYLTYVQKTLDIKNKERKNPEPVQIVISGDTLEKISNSARISLQKVEESFLALHFQTLWLKKNRMCIPSPLEFKFITSFNKFPSLASKTNENLQKIIFGPLDILFSDQFPSPFNKTLRKNLPSLNELKDNVRFECFKLYNEWKGIRKELVETLLLELIATPDVYFFRLLKELDKKVQKEIICHTPELDKQYILLLNNIYEKFEIEPIELFNTRVLSDIDPGLQAVANRVFFRCLAAKIVCDLIAQGKITSDDSVPTPFAHFECITLPSGETQYKILGNG